MPCCQKENRITCILPCPAPPQRCLYASEVRAPRGRFVPVVRLCPARESLHKPGRTDNEADKFPFNEGPIKPIKKPVKKLYQNLMGTSFWIALMTKWEIKFQRTHSATLARTLMYLTHWNTNDSHVQRLSWNRLSALAARLLKQADTWTDVCQKGSDCANSVVEPLYKRSCTFSLPRLSFSHFHKCFHIQMVGGAD